MRLFLKTLARAMALLALAVVLSGCATDGEDTPEASNPPATEESETVASVVPERLKRGDDGAPLLKVYQEDEKSIDEMDVESYLQGVLAGEMKNDWPEEALKAQAILARTFVLKFCAEKTSKYPGADISTDVEEAQAYDATGVNDRIVKVVSETRGQVLTNGDELIYAWFHSHSGGMTATAQEGLAYQKDAPYTQNVEGMESDAAPADAAEWEADFSQAAFLKALADTGLSLETLESVQVGERGGSGRAVTLLCNGQAVSAPDLRIALGADSMRSTLLTSLKMTDGGVHMAGKGFGHGVGMPQWGAYALAQAGKAAEEIVTYYFRDVQVKNAW